MGRKILAMIAILMGPGIASAYETCKDWAAGGTKYAPDKFVAQQLCDDMTVALKGSGKCASVNLPWSNYGSSRCADTGTEKRRYVYGESKNTLGGCAALYPNDSKYNSANYEGVIPSGSVRMCVYPNGGSTAADTGECPEGWGVNIFDPDAVECTPKSTHTEPEEDPEPEIFEGTQVGVTATDESGNLVDHGIESIKVVDETLPEGGGDLVWDSDAGAFKNSSTAPQSIEITAKPAPGVTLTIDTGTPDDALVVEIERNGNELDRKITVVEPNENGLHEVTPAQENIDQTVDIVIDYGKIMRDKYFKAERMLPDVDL